MKFIKVGLVADTDCKQTKTFTSSQFDEAFKYIKMLVQTKTEFFVYYE